MTSTSGSSLNELRSVKAFIFDLDGTLIDSVEAHIKSWIAALSYVGIRNVNENDLRPLIGLSGKDIMIKLFGPNIMSKFPRIRWLKDRAFLKELGEGRITLYPGVTKLLQLLKRLGYRVAIASSTPNHMLMHILDFLGIMQYIDVFTCGDEVVRGKPHPEIFIKTVNKLHLKPEDVVIVGDTVYDVKPANEINSISILVNNPNQDVNPKPRYYFRWIHELVNFLRNEFL